MLLPLGIAFTTDARERYSLWHFKLWRKSSFEIRQMHRCQKYLVWTFVRFKSECSKKRVDCDFVFNNQLYCCIAVAERFCNVLTITIRAKNIIILNITKIWWTFSFNLNHKIEWLHVYVHIFDKTFRSKIS